MGCSGRSKYDNIKPEQKWDFISLNDFKATSCIEPLAYAWLWASLVVSTAVYGVDSFTAVNLLVFNAWTSEVSPAISLAISRWVFSVCIILSWINLGYEYWRAYKVMKRGAVAESYLDPLGVRLQSVRMGKTGRGWRRFLVFAELTRSKKGAEYVALFTYFSFQTWIRVIFCSGPRQVINALTLWAVFQAKLDPKAPDAGSSITQFFKNIGILADSKHQQAIILVGMLFTLVIWVFAALSLLLAVCFYLLFLWHYIPSADGGLSGYCERKINSRLTSIVSAKVNKALQDEERRRLKYAQKAAKKGEAPIVGRQATIPTLFDPKADANNPDKLPGMPMIHRNDTVATLPAYSSRPGTPGSNQQPTVPSFELDDMEQKRPYPVRTNTSSSYASNAPLIGAAGEMGYGRSDSPAPSLPPLDTSGFPFPQRSMTANSNGSQWQNGMSQSSRSGPFGPPSRQPTQDSYQSGYRGAPSRQMTQDGYSDPRGPPSRQNTMDSYTTNPSPYDEYGRNNPRPTATSQNSFSRPLPRPADAVSGRSASGATSGGRRTPFTETDSGGRSSPAQGLQLNAEARSDSESGSYQPRGLNDERSSNGSAGGYIPYNPAMRSASAGITGPATTNLQQQPRPYRNMTEPIPWPNRRPTGDYPTGNLPPRQGSPQSSANMYGDQYSSRQANPQGQRNGYGDPYNGYSGPGGQQRGGGPGGYNGRQGPPPQGGYRR